MTIRLWTSSAGLDPATLVSGRDLVLDLDPRHGVDLAEGVYGMDALTPDERIEVDRLTMASMSDWRHRLDGPLTIEGICWPWIWELDVFEAFNPVIAAASALRAELTRLEMDAVELMDTDPETLLLAQAVGNQLGIEVRLALGALDARHHEASVAALPLARRARRAAAGMLIGLGAPSVLRRNSVLFRPYWTLTDVLDRMLEDRGTRPAISLTKRPAGVRRQVRTGLRGGWLGAPTALDRRRGARLVPRALAALDADPGMPVDGMELGPIMLPRLQALVRRRLAADVAQAVMLRRGLRPGRPRRIIGSSDAEPTERLVVAVAREVGVPTLTVTHGACLMPQEFRDLELCDEAVVWSKAVAPRMTWREGRVHVVGYPLSHAQPLAAQPRPTDRPSVAVLGQTVGETTCIIDQRVTARAYVTAVETLLARFPKATVVLRPHPDEDRAAHEFLLRRSADVDIKVDRTTPIEQLLAGVDLAIGGTSTATLQAALVGTPAMVLNLTGFSWPWPIGGDTPVPVACSAEELDAILERFGREGTLPGADALLAALGANGSDNAQKIVAIAERVSS